MLQVNENQINEYFEMKKKISGAKKVKFCQTEIFSLSKFLSCFDPIPNELNQLEKSKITFEFSKAISEEDKEQLGSFVFSNLFKKYARIKIEDLDEFFEIVPIQKIRLLDLLVYAMLNEGYTSMHALYDMVFILGGFSNSNLENSLLSDNSDSANNLHLFDTVFISEFLPKFKNIIESSNNLINAIMIVWVIRSILIKVIKVKFFNFFFLNLILSQKWITHK